LANPDEVPPERERPRREVPQRRRPTSSAMGDNEALPDPSVCEFESVCALHSRPSASPRHHADGTIIRRGGLRNHMNISTRSTPPVSCVVVRFDRHLRQDTLEWDMARRLGQAGSGPLRWAAHLIAPCVANGTTNPPRTASKKNLGDTQITSPSALPLRPVISRPMAIRSAAPFGHIGGRALLRSVVGQEPWPGRLAPAQYNVWEATSPGQGPNPRPTGSFHQWRRGGRRRSPRRSFYPGRWQEKKERVLPS